MLGIKLNSLSTDNLRGDIFGGATSAIIALPLALAFGVASGMGPIAGLYGAICVGLFAALFGGTNAQVSGPTGPMTIVSASVFTQFASQPALAFTVVMMAGAFQILFGYLRIGRYINLMPYPVISGFMTGIGCILIILQLEPLIGHVAPPTVVNVLTALPSDVQSINWHAVGVGLMSLGVCLWWPTRLTRILPSPLLALILGTVAALFIADVPLLGTVPSGLPSLQMPQFDFAQLSYMLVSAAVLAALGSIDSLLTSLVADNVSRTFHDSDKELIGQGIGNLVAGFAGGLAGAGATVRTLANFKAGGRTPLSGALHAIILLLIVLGLGPVVSVIPHAALAGILLKVGIDVIDWRFLKRWHRSQKRDLILMLVVLALTVFVDVITAVGVGIVMASLVFVKEMADIQVQSIRTIVDDVDHDLLTVDEAEVFRQCNGRAAILHLSGAMSFGAANEMMRRILSVRPVDVLIIDLTDVPSIDGSAALTLEEIIQRAMDVNQEILIVGMQFGVARVLGRLGVLDGLRETMRFSTRIDAIGTAREILAERTPPAS
ncbi:MAG: SulP family inorganic anion transporter [Woeseiaceae bacterium]|nr:SulP family inorganic anion transporter [Woeseiaceae bacterium]